MNTSCAAIMCFLLVPAQAGTHVLTGLATYITGRGAFSVTIMLDDITVGYYNSETNVYVARGNDTNEDDVIDPNNLRIISEQLRVHFIERSHRLKPDNNTESQSHEVHQVMGLCEQNDNIQIMSKTAYRGSTVDERGIIDGNFTHQLFSNYTEEEIIPNLKMSKLRFETSYYPICIKTLGNYLKKRETQVNRKVKPRVKLIQKANTGSGGFRVSCLATGFYPRHINLTLFRDEQPVDDHEITGGDLLPNDDGTYQMRKSLEISAADKHTYTCSVTHLSLDNKLDVTLELSRNHTGVVIAAVAVLLLVCVILAIAVAIYMRRKAGGERDDDNVL